MSELNSSNCPEILYAIREVDTGKVIWNARGSAYKHIEDVSRKLRRLHKENPDKLYALIMWGKATYECDVKFRE